MTSLFVTSRPRLVPKTQSSKQATSQQLGRAALLTQHKLACSSEHLQVYTPLLPRKRSVKALTARTPAIAAAAVEVEEEQQVLQQQPEAPSQTHAEPHSQQDNVQQEHAGASASLPTHMTSLTIRDFALIEEEHVQFKPGLNVVTGESGAGKSVLVEAFGQVLGMPASDHCVRPPATTAVVEACLHLSLSAQAVIPNVLASLGMPKAGRSNNAPRHELFLRRELTKHDDSVRSRCFVNGTATSVRVLREIGTALVDVNGQGAAVSVRDNSTQLALLDRVAGTQAAAAQFGSQLLQLREVEQQLADIAAMGSEEERTELQQMIQEVHSARLEAGEERHLRAELRQLDARRASVERAGLVHQAVTGDGATGGFLEGLQTLEGHVMSILDQEESFAEQIAAERDDTHEADTVGDVDESLAALDEAAATLAEARALLRKAEGQVAAYAKKHRYLQQEHDEASSRLQQVERLLKECECSTSEELLLEIDSAQADLDRWYLLEGTGEELQGQQEVLQNQLQEAAVQLSTRRRAAAGKLKAAVETCLSSLAMSGSQFSAEICWRAAEQGSGLLLPESLSSQVSESGDKAYQVDGTGLDQVTFQLAAGPGEPFRPLAGVASGGESARIMLAMKAAPLTMGKADDAASSGHNESMTPPLMILDELDSGVGARLGKAVGQLLRSLTAHPTMIGSPGQILCVSHLPQVAAYADHHLCVRKSADSEGRVHTRIDALVDQAERAHEIAAMLGLDVSQATQMLEEVHGA